MSITWTPKTVVLEGHAKGKYDEETAGGAITPGHLIDTNSDGEVVVHPTAGGYAERKVAIEDALQGQSTGLLGKGIDDAYAADDKVRIYYALPGDKLYMLLKDGEVATPASFLSSNGDGTLQVVAGAEIPLFKSTESVSPSGAVGRIRVRAL